MFIDNMLQTVLGQPNLHFKFIVKHSARVKSHGVFKGHEVVFFIKIPLLGFLYIILTVLLYFPLEIL